MISRAERGRLAEQQAIDYLTAMGLSLVERNYRCRMGEIDLVMRDGATTAFVEVRYRRSSSHGTAAETVDARKQQRLIRAAGHYLLYRKTGGGATRFDVVAIDGDSPPRWIRGAFSADGCCQ